jgi:hypothetical protein
MKKNKRNPDICTSVRSSTLIVLVKVRNAVMVKKTNIFSPSLKAIKIIRSRDITASIKLFNNMLPAEKISDSNIRLRLLFFAEIVTNINFSSILVHL